MYDSLMILHIKVEEIQMQEFLIGVSLAAFLNSIFFNFDKNIIIIYFSKVHTINLKAHSITPENKNEIVYIIFSCSQQDQWRTRGRYLILCMCACVLACVCVAVCLRVCAYDCSNAFQFIRFCQSLIRIQSIN